MSATIEVEVTVDETTYTATVEGGAVSISRVEDGRAIFAGSGKWDADASRIEDCAADLGDDVYEALEEAIADALVEAE